MIELSKLSKGDAYDLVRGCEAMTFKTQNMKWQRSIYDKLICEFGEEYKICIQHIVTAACKAKRGGVTGIIFPLDRRTFSKINKFRPTNKLSQTDTRKLLVKMEEAGYLTVLKGYRRSDEDKMTTCLRFHDRLLNNLSKKSCDKWGVSRIKDHIHLEVVDPIKSTKYSKVMKSLQSIRGSREIQDEVILVNTEIAEHIITYKGETCVVLYKRRFEGDLQSGGRWYVVGTFQTEDAEGRETIRIDHIPCVGIDIDRIHPSILASIAGFVLPEDYDPYDITSYVKTPIDFKTLRSFMKGCFMALLYASNRNTALYEIRQKLYDDSHIANWLDAETILESLEEHNHMLSEFFYKKDNWKLCQYIDSQICTKVMVHFASKGDVCLGYHDGFICKWQYKQELVDVVTKSWEDVIGNLDNFSYSFDFDKTPKQHHIHPAFEDIPTSYYEDSYNQWRNTYE